MYDAAEINEMTITILNGILFFTLSSQQLLLKVLLLIINNQSKYFPISKQQLKFET